MCKESKIFGRAILLVLACAILGFILLLLVFIIPLNSIECNVSVSSVVFEEEGTYPKIGIMGMNGQLDNFSDALMLLNASFDSKTGVVDKVVNIYRPWIEGETPNNVLIAYYLDKTNTSVVTYGRYWHGYLIILKPLLVVLNYLQIRMLNGALIFISILAMIIVMFCKKRKSLIIPYFLALSIINPYVISKSLQFSSVYYIYTIASLVIILKGKDLLHRKDWVFYFFVVVGCITSYMDLLTYPLVTFGIPFIFLLSFVENCEKQSFKLFLIAGFGWVFGYVGMWAGKWVLSVLLGYREIIGDALTTVIFRSSMINSEGQTFTVMEMLRRQFKDLNSVLFILMIMYVIFVIIDNLRERKRITKRNCDEQRVTNAVRGSIMIVYLLVFFLPFGWYILASNHSYIHYWFTYRELMISAFSGMSFCVRMKQ